MFLIEQCLQVRIFNLLNTGSSFNCKHSATLVLHSERRTCARATMEAELSRYDDWEFKLEQTAA